MVGGTTSGYSLIGSRHMDSRPTMKTTIDNTPAKIGRRMKKCEKFIKVVQGIGGTGVRVGSARFKLLARHVQVAVLSEIALRRYRHSRTHTLQAVHHNLFAR